ncbi:MAG: site-specific integrase [Lachnospiraceae bacterium]|nr:site-specific integrase [Lachnospiraceae bacterium]
MRKKVNDNKTKESDLDYAILLQSLIQRGNIDLTAMQQQVIMRDIIIKNHPYKIWQGKGGKWYTYLPHEDKGRVLKVRTTEQAIRELVYEYWANNQSIVTIKDAFDEWNNTRYYKGKISPSTHTRNRQMFERFFKEFGQRDITKVTPIMWQDFLEEQIHIHNLKAKAFSGLKSIVRGMLKRAKKNGYICFNVTEMLEDMDITEREFAPNFIDEDKEVFNEDEYPLVVEYLIKNPDIINLGILLMFETGIRVGELVTLKYEDFNDTHNAFTIRRTETRYINPLNTEKDEYITEVKFFPKTEAGLRTVLIPDSFGWIYAELRKLNLAGEWVFMANDSRIVADKVRKRLYKVCDKVGIPRKSPHKVRKTYASILLENKVDNKMVIGLMGHTNITTTEIHYHRNRKGMERKLAVLNSIPDLNLMKVSND